MGLVNIRNTVRAHLFRERFEVLLAVMIPFLFMAESGYACAWILVDGHLGLDFTSVLAFARGFAIEAFVFVCFKLVRIFLLKGSKLSCIFPLVIGLVAVIVSAGMNLGFMVQSPEMRAVMASIASYMPDWMTSTFRLGLGLLFPIGVALFALFDVRHLIDDMIASAHLDDRAFIIQKAEAWRAGLTKFTKQAIRQNQERLKEFADADAQNMLNSIRSGDLSFGMRDLAKVSPSVTKVSPVAPTLSQRPTALPAPGQGQRQLPPIGSQSAAPSPLTPQQQPVAVPPLMPGSQRP
jgi:hypothetical protein